MSLLARVLGTLYQHAYRAMTMTNTTLVPNLWTDGRSPSKRILIICK